LLLEPVTDSNPYEITLTRWPESSLELAGRYQLHVSLLTRSDDFEIPTDRHIACLDADVLTFPITIRPWRLGDRFRPLGLKGTKLVSDLLNDLKLSRTDREETAVLLSGDQIAWVIGRRVGHAFRITAQTSRIVKLILEGK
jgi:tRNA(Ile)-lysidine synthase